MADYKNDGVLHGDYNKLANSKRFAFLSRARQCALLTIPALCPPEGSSGTDVYQNPKQDIGASGVKHLAAKLLLALFPTQTPFFKYALEESVVQEAEELEEANPELRESGGSIRGELEKKLLERERVVQDYSEQKALRVQLAEAFKHLIVAGNVLLRFTIEGKLKLHRLESYVVERDYSGNVLRIILHENIAFRALPPELQQAVRLKDPSLAESDALDLYTEFKLREDGKKWDTQQEVSGVNIESSKGDYLPEDLPVIPLRWSAQPDEDYGRSMIEDHVGSLDSLEILTEYVNATAKAAAKTIFLVDPASTLKPSKLAKTPNLGFVTGREGDIKAFGLDKLREFQLAESRINKLEHRLSSAFLMNSSVSRDAERVTAEEIRFLAQELETTFGGVYSVFSQELQLPLLTYIEARLSKEKKLDKLPSGVVRPVIITGIEALGRGASLDSLLQFFAVVEKIPEAKAELNLNEVLLRAATYLGVDTDGLLKSAAQKKQEQEEEAQREQQAMTADMMKPAVAPIAQAASKQMIEQPPQE